MAEGEGTVMAGPGVGRNRFRFGAAHGRKTFGLNGGVRQDIDRQQRFVGAQIVARAERAWIPRFLLIDEMAIVGR